MGNVRMFAAINTKVRALERNFLKDEDYRNLLTKKNIAEVLEFLKETRAYEEILKNIDFHNVEVDALELLFKKYGVKQYGKLIHYFTGSYRKFFKILLKRYEIEDLKLYLRSIMVGEDLSHIKKLIICSGRYCSIHHEILVHSKSIEDFIENLKATAYYDLLKPYLNEEPQKRLFYMEMVLDRYYFKLFSEQTEKLEGENKKILREFLGKNIDLLNLQWIYRGLKFYKLSPEELINYTLHNGYSLNYRKIKEICYTKNEEDLINKMIDSKYGFLFDNKDTLEMFMERRMKRYLYFLVLEYKRRGKMNIIDTLVYRHLLEFEMRDVITIMEAIKYGLNPEVSKGYLVRKI